MLCWGQLAVGWERPAQPRLSRGSELDWKALCKPRGQHLRKCWSPVTVAVNVLCAVCREGPGSLAGINTNHQAVPVALPCPGQRSHSRSLSNWGPMRPNGKSPTGQAPGITRGLITILEPVPLLSPLFLSSSRLWQLWGVMGGVAARVIPAPLLCLFAHWVKYDTPLCLGIVRAQQWSWESLPPSGTGRLVQERAAHLPHQLSRLLVKSEDPWWFG